MLKHNPTSDELASAFGQRVRELRTQRSELSQERLADIVGVHRSFIGRVERGETNVTLANLYRICTGLDVTLAEFFYDFENLILPKNK
ncbi:MAG: helix-turn-helix domain-containing protein [Chloroflexi bacterium]|nr:helix-turn-helix domain-containing protein [Chloroflexota bacterium]MCC6894145.1 helix-turn-helix transcriptional regulator [Anaerolineae bacterium]